MYFPYLRGKQYELLALRELAGLLGESRTIISPIIEPVKESSTLKSALGALTKNGINFTLIMNPSVGQMSKDGERVPGFQYLKGLLRDCRNYQIGLIVDGSNFSSLLDFYGANATLQELQPDGFTVIHNEAHATILDFEKRISDDFGWNIKFNVVNFRRTNRRYHRQFDETTLVSLDDYFIGLGKNADYLNQDESQFSEEHLHFRNEGFIGFSDFLTIGDNYTESGFLPRAVAIHLSYADAQRRIRIKHFVSDSNSDTVDVAGKFAEANNKLVNWCDNNNIQSKSVEEFRKLHNLGHFPGLGTIKKLSIMNHIELVISLI